MVFSQSFFFFRASSYEEFISYAGQSRVIYLGETHDREDIHRFQLKVLKELLSKGHKLVILMEAFQQPFQEALDDYVNCEIEEDEMLRRTQYKKRWGFDKELYAPIWRFAKENYIKLFALNVPTELLREVRKEGIEKVVSRYLPGRLTPLREKHKEFLRKALGEHSKKINEDRFFNVQLTWDTGMAYKIAKTALAYPQHKLVVIVGSGHVWRGYGIPERVNSLLGELPQLVIYFEEDEAYFLFSKDFSKESSSTNSSSEPN